MKLIFIHGLPGVGKLTVARALAALLQYKLFHNHLTVDLVGSVFEFGSVPFVDLRESIWLNVFARAAEEGLGGLVFTFVFERTVRDDFFRSVRETVESRGGSVLPVELTCGRDELERRLTDSSREKFGKLRSVEKLDELLSAGAIYRPALTPPAFVVDTTALSPEGAASRIADHYGLGQRG